jgi:hypothetical protein
MTTLEKIQQLQSYKKILSDSFGGVLYDVDNRGKYDTGELLRLWESLQPYEKEEAGGIMKGAINFISGRY